MVTWFYFIVLVLSLIMVGSFLIRNEKVDTFSILFGILVSINCMGRYMLSVSETLEMAIWANKFMYVGGCYAPFMTVLLLTKLCELKLPRILSFALFGYSTVVMGLVLTIGQTDIYYKHIELAHGNGYNYLLKTYGPFHALYPAMMALYALIMVIYLLLAFRKRKQISFHLVATISVVAFCIFFMYIVERLIKTNINFLSLGYLFGIAFIIKYYERIYMYDMSTNISSSIERMSEYGYIVFDNRDRYVNANNYIKKLFPEINTWISDREVEVTDSYLYKEVVQYLMQWNGQENAHKYISINDIYFQLTIRPISYRKKGTVGYLLEFIDRTMEKKYYNTIEEYNISMEKEVAEKTKVLRDQQVKIEHLFVQIVTALSDAVDAKDRYTSGHSKRVAKYARLIAERMGKSREEQEEIYRAGLLHDVGKIRIPEEKINKPGKLTDEEFNMIKLHPITGYHILRGISEENFIATGAKYHHERYDGKGYPNSLEGEKIPEVARILAVADAYDAMASNRSYRNALPQEVVRSEIENGRGTQFDPVIADIMLRMMDEDKEYQMRQIDSMHRRILTVDDERMNHKIVAHIMEDEPMYELVSVGSGREALEILEQQKFDLILLDVMMPDMDGLETLRLIRKKNQTPVVLMTGDKTLATLEKFEELGCHDYVTKPFSPLLMKEVIYNMMKINNG